MSTNKNKIYNSDTHNHAHTAQHLLQFQKVRYVLFIYGRKEQKKKPKRDDIKKLHFKKFFNL